MKWNYRKNIIPFAVYRNDTNTLHYPYTNLYSSTLMSKKVRDQIPYKALCKDAGNVAIMAVHYTPYIKWTEFDLSPIKKYVADSRF